MASSILPGATAPTDNTTAPKAESLNEAAYLLATGISTLKVLSAQLTRDASDDLENAFHGALLLLERAHAELAEAA